MMQTSRSRFAGRDHSGDGYYKEATRRDKGTVCRGVWLQSTGKVRPNR